MPGVREVPDIFNMENDAKSDVIKTDEQRTFVYIQSSMRNVNYPTTSKYKIDFPRRFVNVKALNIRSVLLPKTNISTANSAFTLKFEIEGYFGVVEITIPAAEYTISTLVAAINNQLTDLIDTYTITAYANSSTGLIEFRAWRELGLLNNCFKEYNYRPIYCTTNNAIQYTIGSDVIATIPSHGLATGDTIEIKNSSRNSLNGIHAVNSVLDPNTFGLKVSNVLYVGGSTHFMKSVATVSSSSGGSVPFIAPGTGDMFGTWSRSTVETWRTGTSGSYLKNSNIVLNTSALNIYLSPVGNYLVSNETSGWNAYKFTSNWEQINTNAISYPETGPTAVIRVTDNLDYVSYSVGQTFGIYVRNGSSWIYRAGNYPVPVGSGITYTRDSNLRLDINLNGGGKMSLLMYPVNYNGNVSASSVKSTWFYNLDYTVGATQFGEYQHVIAPGITWINTPTTAFEAPGYINNHSKFNGDTYVVSEYIQTTSPELSRIIKYNIVSGETNVFTPYPTSVIQSLDIDIGPLFGRILAVSESGDYVVAQNAQVDDPYGGILLLFRGHPVYYFDYTYIGSDVFRRMVFGTVSVSNAGNMFIYDGNNFQLVQFNFPSTTKSFGGGNIVLSQPRKLLFHSTTLLTTIGISAGVSRTIQSNNNIVFTAITFLRGINRGYDQIVLPDSTSMRYLTNGAEINISGGCIANLKGPYVLLSGTSTTTLGSTLLFFNSWVFRPELNVSGLQSYFIPTNSLITGDRFDVGASSQLVVSTPLGQNIYQTNTAINTITWTQLSGFTGNTTNQIIWSSRYKLFVMVANSNNLYTSPDLVNWTFKSLSISSTWSSIAYGNNIFIVVASDVSRSRYSINGGVTWINPATMTVTLRRICFSSTLNLFVAVGDGNIQTTTDGITWTSIASPDVGASWISIIYSPELGLFVAVKGSISGSSSNSIMTSTTGTSGWTMQTSTTGSWTSIVWSGSLSIFLVMGSSGVMTSSNGSTWNYLGSLLTIVGSVFTTTDLIWVDELDIFVYNNATARVRYSYTGSTWITDTISINASILAWSPELNMIASMKSSGINDMIYTRDFIPINYRWTNGDTMRYSYENHKLVKTYFAPSSGITQYFKIKMPYFTNNYNELDRYSNQITRVLGVSYVVYPPMEQLTFTSNQNQFYGNVIGGTSVRVPLLESDRYQFLQLSGLGHSAQIEEGGGIVNSLTTGANIQDYLARVQLPTSGVMCKYVSGGIQFKTPLRQMESAIFSWYDQNNVQVTAGEMPEHNFVLEVIEYIDNVQINNHSGRTGVVDKYRITDIFDISS